MTRYPRVILGTACIPWNEDGSLAEGIFRDEIRTLIAGGIPDLYLFGTAGEGYAVGESQFDRIIRVFLEEMANGGSNPMVGVISLSMQTILERIEHAGKLGVRAFQISLPSWGPLTEPEVFTFFREVCGRFPEFQFLHYNLPRTKRIVTPDEYARLVPEVPNLVATKFGSSDMGTISGLLTRAPELRHFLTESGFAFGSMLGEPGFLVSVAEINFERMKQYFRAGVGRDYPTLSSLQRELIGLHDLLVTATAGGGHMDGAYDKMFSKLHDPRFPLRLLPPYQAHPEAAFEAFRDGIRAKFPRWLEDGPSSAPAC